MQPTDEPAYAKNISEERIKALATSEISEDMIRAGVHRFAREQWLPLEDRIVAAYQAMRYLARDKATR